DSRLIPNLSFETYPQPWPTILDHPRRRADALHARAPRVPPAGSEIRRERDQSSGPRMGREGVDSAPSGGESNGRAGHARARIRPSVRRARSRPPLHGDPGGGTGSCGPRFHRHGDRRHDGHGNPLSTPVRNGGTQREVPGAGPTRRADLCHRRHRARCRFGVAGIRTRAVRDGDHWVINGSKMFITNSLQADWLCLLARTSDEGGYSGMSQIIVPTDVDGFEVSRKLDKMGMRASDTGLLSFTDVRVPVANTIGTEGMGFQQQMAQFVIERMWAAYGTAAACKLALERTRGYLADRSVFGKPLLQHQYVQFKLAELAAEVDMLAEYN